MIISLATICFAFPYFLIVCLVIAVFFAILFQAYRSGVREFKRYENIYRYAITTLCLECLQLFVVNFKCNQIDQTLYCGMACYISQ